MGKDTRISGDILEGAIVAGICSQGAHAVLAGVIPKPGVAFLGSFINTASIKGVGLVLDCANGAVSKVAPKIFRELGAEVAAIF